MYIYSLALTGLPFLRWHVQNTFTELDIILKTHTFMSTIVLCPESLFHFKTIVMRLSVLDPD